MRDGVSGVVAVAHPLPDWSTTDIRGIYDLRPLDADDPATRAARVVMTTGPQPLGAAALDLMPHVGYVLAIGSGCEGLDLAYLARRGIVVTNSARATANDVADMAVAITLALYARILPLDRAVREDQWHQPPRRSLGEQRVGIVGLGAIGQAVATRMTAFGCEIRWTGPRAKPAPYPFEPDLLALAEWADILIVAARADATNRGLIDRAVIDRLGPDGLLANVSRGSIVDEPALVDALREHRLGGAALDVFAQEPTPGARWRDLDNVVLTPHVAGRGTGMHRAVARLVRANLDAFFAGRSPAGQLTPR